VRSVLSKYARPLKFVTIGVINTLSGYGIFAVLYFLTASGRVALVVATVVGILFNFFSTGRIVFGNRRLGAMPAFVAGYAFLFVANVVLFEVLTTLGLHPLLAQCVCLPCIVVLGYLINAHFVFARRP